MDITVPPSFPMDEFRAFGLATVPFFPKLLSDDDLNDPLRRRSHCDAAWQAVRYRFRICHECNEEFKALHANPSEMWQAGWGDQELSYKFERCIYTFFMSALSVFESYGYCLYFVGNALQTSAFPAVANPRNITLKGTTKAFNAAFPTAKITAALTALWTDARFTSIDGIRNVLAHRLVGGHSVRSSSTKHEDGTYTVDWHEETWHIPGSTATLTFDDGMLQRQLDDVAALLTTLTAAAREFMESVQPAEATTA